MSNFGKRMAFVHTTFNSLETNITLAFIDEFWSYLSEKIKASQLFDDYDKAELFKSTELLDKFKASYADSRTLNIFGSN